MCNTRCESRYFLMKRGKSKYTSPFRCGFSGVSTQPGCKIDNHAMCEVAVAYRGGGGRGGHGPRAQALEGAPAQLVGANFKSRGEFQPSKSSIYSMGSALPMH